MIRSKTLVASRNATNTYVPLSLWYEKTAFMPKAHNVAAFTTAKIRGVASRTTAAQKYDDDDDDDNP